ncbi:MAG: hypothetical protein Q7V15_09430 [Phenylobacterium sp.]|uniref:hypothetical protein n=1 Tax=Phenylobacterium sp. TaxID=1871053 RepID=UPI002717AA83|nr:hypothetical protein [Phenylobacterium sp.]MDO8901563.1 hypothetical protein [Phenylobacterium sp.]MDP2214672.1 hypothetical protein [Phenylobacterium sp.]
MIRSILSLTAAAALLAACGGQDNTAETDTTQGPVVSASESPRNEAIDTQPNMGDGAQTPGASSFTEGQARGAIESAGYTQVGPLTQNEQGLWQGTATRNGAEVQVSVDYRGAVTPTPAN